ncbi:MAG TPA: hypothetical protein VHG28_12720 [Longimicrobiaceae bacterium]|nr:hypothetical protein [Longimicrobiaceae bacterium]
MGVTGRFWVPVLAAGLVLGGCRVEQTGEGEVPEVEVKGGELPKIDIDPVDVDVTVDTQQVVVPRVDVDPAKEPGGEEKDSPR